MQFLFAYNVAGNNPLSEGSIIKNDPSARENKGAQKRDLQYCTADPPRCNRAPQIGGPKS